jgi:hypothetical protein
LPTVLYILQYLLVNVTALNKTLPKKENCYLKNIILLINNVEKKWINILKDGEI